MLLGRAGDLRFSPSKLAALYVVLGCGLADLLLPATGV
jgi:hypothetical protein